MDENTKTVLLALLSAISAGWVAYLAHYTVKKKKDGWVAYLAHSTLKKKKEKDEEKKE